MKFLAIEHELPSRQVTNDEVVERVLRASSRHLTSSELDLVAELMRNCFESAGTKVRHCRAEGETASGLTRRAGERAISAAGLLPEDIDLVLYAGIGRGVLEPATAVTFQDLLGLRQATAFDVLDACASWLRALDVARAYLALGVYRNIMIVNAEFGGGDEQRHELRSVEEFPHWHPAITIGEAATAAIVTAENHLDVYEADFRTWGAKRSLCFVPLEGFDGYFGKEVDVPGGVAPMRFVSFGLRLMEFGTRRIIEHYQERPQFERFRPDRIFGHSASDGMSEYVLEACGIDTDRFHFDHHRHANTAAASIPLGMSQAMKSGRLLNGDRVVLMAASAGVTTALMKFVFHDRTATAKELR
ncbi:3-oxoacyl-ACP synthase III family protein [Streptomyces sp. NPDC050658]|uniref:3-oxoacyl-ACP synthase III family protein n=1 Tax=unclassified Streptomyces TaxID=2593676 RepID=UPI0034371238